MEQINKEYERYLQYRGFMDDDGNIVDSKIQETALKEAVMFSGTLLENGTNLTGLQAIALYLEELAAKKDYEYCYQYADLCYKNNRKHGELDGFYTAALDEDALMVYAIYFSVYLVNLANKLNETQLEITVKQAMQRKGRVV